MTMADRGQIKLPPPLLKGNVSLEETISRRRSVRTYRADQLSLYQLSQVLWAAQGITDARKGNRAAPSAGATYPLEIFAVIGKGGVDGIAEGIYHYKFESHSLSLHRPGDLRSELSAAALGQRFITIAPASIIICALYQRTSQRYGTRAERYIQIEVGHVGQNIYLQARALGLATVAVGAFTDEEVWRSLEVEEQIKPLYIMPLGKPG